MAPSYANTRSLDPLHEHQSFSKRIDTKQSTKYSSAVYRKVYLMRENSQSLTR